jgi:hypothetical protein
MLVDLELGAVNLSKPFVVKAKLEAITIKIKNKNMKLTATTYTSP